MATRIISAGDAASRPVRKAAGIFDGKRTAELTRLQIESEEPAIDDGDIFAGYDRADTVPLSELVDAESHRGVIVLVDPDNEIWGLVDAIEPDLEEDYVAIDFRNLSDGEPGSISLPEGDTVTLRRPLEMDE